MVYLKDYKNKMINPKSPLQVHLKFYQKAIQNEQKETKSIQKHRRDKLLDG